MPHEFISGANVGISFPLGPVNLYHPGVRALSLLYGSSAVPDASYRTLRWYSFVLSVKS